MTGARLIAVVLLMVGALLLTYRLGVAPEADTAEPEARSADAASQPRGILEERAPEDVHEQRVNVADSPTLKPIEDAPVTDQAHSAEPDAPVEPDWQSTYASMSKAELKVEQMTLIEQMHEMTSSAFQEYMEMGRYEVTGIGIDKYIVTQDKETVSSLIYHVPTEEVRKVVLPESEFPDAYRLMRRMSILNDAYGALRK